MPIPPPPPIPDGAHATWDGRAWTVVAPRATRIPPDDVVRLFTVAEQVALHTLVVQDSPAGATGRMILEQFRMGAAAGGIDPARPEFATGMSALVPLGVLADAARADALIAAARALLAPPEP